MRLKASLSLSLYCLSSLSLSLSPPPIFCSAFCRMASVEAALGLIQPCGEPEVNFMLFGCSIPLCTALPTQPDFAHHRSGLTSGEKEVAEPICVQDDGGKVVKKPDKLLACPRCSSLDTKFCYFNNCNVSQPRHFCKRCQRYWTSGGTMRDVPVGSGRRKGKHSSAFSHPRFRNTARSDTLVESTLQLPQQGTARHSKMGGCSVQEFCSVPPFTSPSDAIPVLSYGKEAETGLSSDEQNATSEKKKLASSSSSVGTQIFSSKQPPVTEQPFSAAEFFMGGYPFSFPMGLWPYGYGPFPAPVSPMIPHAFAIPPWPLMPIPPWGPPPAQNAPPFREGGAEEGFPLTPKTLRIHHPAEAAQSSIWSALGLDYKSDFPVSAGAIFDGFPLKAVVAVTEEPPTVDAICSNPAAVTRSMVFHEGS